MISLEIVSNFEPDLLALSQQVMYGASGQFLLGQTLDVNAAFQGLIVTIFTLCLPLSFLLVDKDIDAGRGPHL